MWNTGATVMVKQKLPGWLNPSTTRIARRFAWVCDYQMSLSASLRRRGRRPPPPRISASASRRWVVAASSSS